MANYTRINSLFLVPFILFSTTSFSQVKKRALFLGNSYTFFNDLPLLTANMALSSGDTLVFEMSAPGGHTFEQHCSNATSLQKIAAGNWDFVVLQEQSQLPSFNIEQVNQGVFPYARRLDSLINTANPCAETVFFMTWGRKNGDASNCAVWPPICTYEGMDSLLNLRYRMMADSNDALLSPAGAVWNYLRQNFPNIELYNADESHPSLAGSYAAAVCFYTVLFRKDPELISFNSTLDATTAANMRAAVKEVVYNNFGEWHVGEHDPKSDYNYTIAGENQVAFENNSLNAEEFIWDFGDGTTSAELNPVHSFAADDIYFVTLVSTTCGLSDTMSQSIDLTTLGNSELNANKLPAIFPNPAENTLRLSGLNNKCTFKIFSCTGAGAIVKEGIIDNYSPEINIGSLNSGFYYLTLEQKNTFYKPLKFVKK